MTTPRRPLARPLFRKPEAEPARPASPPAPTPGRSLRLERGIAVHGTIAEHAPNGRRPSRLLVSIAIEGGNPGLRQELAERALAEALRALEQPVAPAEPPLPAVFSLLAGEAPEPAPEAGVAVSVAEEDVPVPQEPVAEVAISEVAISEIPISDAAAPEKRQDGWAEDGWAEDESDDPYEQPFVLASLSPG